MFLTKQSPRRRALNLVLVLALFAVLVLVFGRDHAAILASLQSLSAGRLCLLLAVGFGYQLLDAAACWTLLRGEYPAITYRQAFEVTLLGQFAAVTTFSAGTGPLQSWYLHKCGIRAGSGLGYSMFEYILHKLSILLFGAGMLAAAYVAFPQSLPLVRPYLLFGFVVSGGFAAALLLLCTWEPLRRLLLRLAERLPNTGRWPARRQLLTENLDALYHSTRGLLRNRSHCARVIAVSCVKLAVLYLLPVLCLQSVGCDSLTLWQGEILSAFMLLLSGALPNVAGMGSAEYAFISLYSPFVGNGAASAAMVLYRLATYFFPFAVSAVVFWAVQRRLGKAEE